jgi:hypothetical protein
MAKFEFTTPFNVLPVAISLDDYEMLTQDKNLKGCYFIAEHIPNTLYMPIEPRHDGAKSHDVNFLDLHFDCLLDEALEQDCEAIMFYANE